MNLLLPIALIISFIVNVFLYAKKRKSQKSDSNTDGLLAEKTELKFSNLNFKKEYERVEMFSRLVEQSPNAIMIMDREANILSINEGFSSMYEYTFKEFTAALGTNYRQTSFSSEVENRLKSLEDTKQAFRYEALNVTKTGRQIWTQTALVPILGEDGEITHLVTIDTDINERIVKSDQLVMALESLNARFDELTQQFRKLENEFSSLFSSMSGLYTFVENTNEILVFIKSISDETRILGFNASIEASRAGEHGKGFRVITNEIIDISAKTIESIAEIKGIVDTMTKKQSELMLRKEDSSNRMDDFHRLIANLKSEIITIEKSIEEFKSLA